MTRYEPTESSTSRGGEVEPLLTAGVVLVGEIDGTPSVLLVRHGEDSGHVLGSLGIPAGKIKPGETPTSAAIRELQEETGLTVRHDSLRPLPVIRIQHVTRRDGNTLPVIGHGFICDRSEGNLKPGDRETEPLWVSLEALVGLADLPNYVYDVIVDAMLRACGYQLARRGS